jgi:hypothetical protein
VAIRRRAPITARIVDVSATYQDRSRRLFGDSPRGQQSQSGGNATIGPEAKGISPGRALIYACVITPRDESMNCRLAAHRTYGYTSAILRH